MAEALVREWIVEILERRTDVTSFAIPQRAKFEGWLKFELAAHMKRQGIEDVKVEENSFEEGDGHSRSDIAFSLNGTRYYVELKTANTSWKVSGTPYIKQSTTNNIQAIINDANTLLESRGQGIIAFVFFPIRPDVDDKKWEAHLKRIASKLKLPLSKEKHTARVHVLLENGHTADIIVCCFDVPKTALSSKATASEATDLEAQEELILRLQ